MNESQSRIPPLAAIPAAVLAVSTASVVIRYAQSFTSSLTIAACRLMLSTCLLMPIVFLRYRGELRDLSRKEIWLAFLSGGLLGVHFASWISSLEYTTVASSVVLVSTSPLWVALLSPVFLREKITRVVLVGLALALAGGIIVGISDSCLFRGGGVACPGLADFLSGKAFLGNILALIGALTGAGYLMVGRRLRVKLTLVPYIFIVYGTASLGLVLAMLIRDGVPTGYPARVYVWFLFLALVPQLLGHSLFNWALRYQSAGYVSIALLGEPMGSTILAYIFLGEAPSGSKIFGAILILLGIVIASLQRTRTIRLMEE